MKTFEVTFEVLGSVTRSIEAESLTEARVIAKNMKNDSCTRELEEAFIGKPLIFEEQFVPR